MRAIICTNMTEWKKFEDHIHHEMLEDGANQIEWSQSKVHPVNGKFAFIIGSDLDEARIEKYLTESELNRIVDLPKDWFPETKEEL